MRRWDAERFQSDIYDNVHSKRKDLFLEDRNYRPRQSRLELRAQVESRGWRPCRGKCGRWFPRGLKPLGLCDSCRLFPCRRGCGELVDIARERTCARCRADRGCRIDGCRRRAWSLGLCEPHLRVFRYGGVDLGEVAGQDVWPGRVVLGGER